MSSYFVHPLLRAHNWQHRPQLDAVCDWWRRGGRGVCALIGMGGAGKTAVAERFLRLVPGGLPDGPRVDKAPSLPTPHSTFAFSFYDAPNADAFFESLQMWLEDTPRVGTLVSIGQMLFMLQRRQGLIVLDGLERVQDDGRRGEFGRLHSPRLRDFLNQLASGNFSDLSVLVTSRFPLADLRDRNSRFFHLIPVNQIDIAAGVQLLRDRGVRGTDPQLALIVEQCGRHALTVDFAGGYIAEYGAGDPATPLDLGTAEMSRPDQAQRRSGSDDESPERRFARSGLLPTGQNFDELDEDQREVLRQGYRFARIAEHYRNAMLSTDEAAMALLERICLLRLGVDSETLAAIFTGEQAVEVSGPALAGLNREQLQSKLDWLVRMRIVESSSPVSPRPDAGLGETRLQRQRVGPVPTGQKPEPDDRPVGTGPTYSIHPAVRDGFLSGISRDAAVAGHEAVRQGLEVSLGDAPGENPSDPATLDMLEEIVHHTLQSGHVGEAWDIYRNRIGNYQNLLWRLGAYERGERICRAFAGGQSPETLFRSETRQEKSRPDQAKRSSGSTASSSQIMPERRHSVPRSGLRRNPTEAASARLPTDGDAPSTSLPLPLGEGPGEDAALGRMPFLDLPESTQAIFIASWGIYLRSLGRLAAAARCYEVDTEMSMRHEDWQNASIGNQNLAEVWLLSGRLSRLPLDAGDRRKDEMDESLPPSSFGARPSEASPATSARLGASGAGALATADEALRLAELADDAEMRQYSHAVLAQSTGLSGDVKAALRCFQDSLVWQHKDEHEDTRPLYSRDGTWHTHMLARLGRCNESLRLTGENQKIWANEHEADGARCQLVLSSLSIERSGSPSSGAASSSADLWTQARDWALARDAKEVLCWSCLVEAQHALAKVAWAPGPCDTPDLDHGPGAHATTTLAEAGTALESGLKIARDCGFGLYHIDLLLERARLHLLRGDARAALDDVELALETGISANHETGQPELLAARHDACGYAWAIPAGLLLRAEAMLLEAAQELGTDSFVPAKLRELPTGITTAINQARERLREAIDLWQPLHDPEPERDDQNFKLDGKEYNYKAAETHRILTDLDGGVLTRYPLHAPTPEPSDDSPPESDATDQTADSETDTNASVYDAFISYRRVDTDRAFARKLLHELEAAGYKVAIDERDFVANRTFLEEMERCTRESRFTLAVISKAYFESRNTEEEAIVRKVRDMAENRRGLIPLTIEQVDDRPVWLYDVVGVDFTETDPLVAPMDKLKQALGEQAT